MGRLSVFAMKGFGIQRYNPPATIYRHDERPRLTRRQKGMVIKWSILGSLFALFMLWFIGGYVHAKRRLKAGKPLLAYHRVRLSLPRTLPRTLPPPPFFLSDINV